MPTNPPFRDRLASASPLVAVPLTDATPDDDLRVLAAAGLDVVEARIDLFSSTEAAHVIEHVTRMAAVDGPATIATIRAAAEGGSWAGSEEDRLALFLSVMPLVDAIDVELAASTIRSAVIDAAHAAGRLTVVSAHDFAGTPSLADLTSIVAEARAAGADVVKIATTTRTIDDLRTLAALILADVAEAQGSIAVVGMGTFGPASRIVLPTLGSRLTFASHGEPLVPGQLTFDETLTFLRRLSPT